MVDKVLSIPCNKMVVEWMKEKDTLRVEGLYQVPQLGPGQFAIRAFIPENMIRAFVPEWICFQCKTKFWPEFAEPLEYFFFRKVGVLEAKVKVCWSQVEGGGKKVTLQLRKIYVKISSPLLCCLATIIHFPRDLLGSERAPLTTCWTESLLLADQASSAPVTLG